MHRSDVIAGFFLAIVGFVTIFAIVPHQISGHSDYGIAPNVYPLTLLWLFSVLSLALGIHRLFKWTTLKAEPILTRADWVFVIGSTVFLIIAFIGITTLGFRWSGPVLLLIMLALIGVWPKRAIPGILVAVITPLFLYYVFWNVFRIPLP